MAGASRSFATPRATPTAPSRTGTVISEKAGHGHPEAARDTDEPVDDAGIPGLLDPVDGLPVQATELAELVLREIALQAETSHAIPDALPLAQDLRIALLGHHLTLVETRSKVSTTGGTPECREVNAVYPTVIKQLRIARMFDLVQ